MSTHSLMTKLSQLYHQFKGAIKTFDGAEYGTAARERAKALLATSYSELARRTIGELLFLSASPKTVENAIAALRGKGAEKEAERLEELYKAGKYIPYPLVASLLRTHEIPTQGVVAKRADANDETSLLESLENGYKEYKCEPASIVISDDKRYVLWRIDENALWEAEGLVSCDARLAALAVGEKPEGMWYKTSFGYLQEKEEEVVPFVERGRPNPFER